MVFSKKWRFLPSSHQHHSYDGDSKQPTSFKALQLLRTAAAANSSEQENSDSTATTITTMSAEKNSICGVGPVNSEEEVVIHMVVDRASEADDSYSNIGKRKKRWWQGGSTATQLLASRELARKAERNKVYTHCFKLFVLFVLALVHVLYMHPFLQISAQLEQYALHADFTLIAMRAHLVQRGGRGQTGSWKAAATPGAAAASAMPILTPPQPLAPLSEVMAELDEYKKNVWMTVAAMCVALSTSCYFLFLGRSGGSSNATDAAPPHYLHYSHMGGHYSVEEEEEEEAVASGKRPSATTFLIGLADVISFILLPLLLANRILCAEQVQAHLPAALLRSHRLVSAEQLMNALQCSVQPREKLPLCHELILHSSIPVDLLKWLLVLSVLTLSYIGVVYLIIWCVKHWIPHAAEQRESQHEDREEGGGSKKKIGHYCHCCPFPLQASSAGETGSLGDGLLLPQRRVGSGSCYQVAASTAS